MSTVSMERTIVPKPEYLSPEWHEVRRATRTGHIMFGASEIPALMGASPFATVQDIVVNKINRAPSPQTDATRRGHILEPALIAHAADEYKAKVEVPSFMFRRGRIIATLDGAEMDEMGVCTRVFEAKTTTAYGLDEPLPETFFWQGQAQLDATGADMVVFVCLDRFMRIGFWELRPDLAAIEQMHIVADRIGTKIESGEMLTNKDIPFTAQQVERLFPSPKGEIELSPAVIRELELLGSIQDLMREMKSQEKAARDAVANALRDAEYGTVGGQRVVSYKRQSRKNGVDAEAFFRDHPDMAKVAAEKYRKKDSEFRVLRRLASHNKEDNE